MTDHLSPAILNALADGELYADQLAGTLRHLAECQSCTAKALHESLLKSATAKAGQRYAPAANLQERLAYEIRQESMKRQRSRRPIEAWSRAGRFYGWAAACALLLVCASVLIVPGFIIPGVARRESIASLEYAAVATEVCDQHIATLAANSPPQVISSDRHTVKPWFQGKLPFSFNLPENLPNDTTLDGANLTYIHSRPTAQLLYSIGKHRVSVYLQQRTDTEITNGRISSGRSTEHSGFHVASFSAGDLDGIAVSDVDAARLSDLIARINQAQGEVHELSK